MATHQAALLLEKGAPFSIGLRPTPQPGAHEVLIDVRAVALNPVDHVQRDIGMAVPAYPAVIGNDVAGVVVAVGSNVHKEDDAPRIGSRVLAFGSSFFHYGNPDYGAFQKRTLARIEGVIGIPDNISFEEAAKVPLAALTALTAWTVLGIPLTTRYTPADRQAVLIWGASSSVGTFAVQSARILGFTVFATASAAHHAYLTQLGAHAVFDYKSSDAVAQIVSAIRRAGFQLCIAHAVVDGALQPVLEVLKQVKGSAHAKVAHSPVLPDNHPTLDNTTILFNFPPADAAQRDKHTHALFHQWIAPHLASGSVVPSPKAQIEDGGLAGVNAALDKLKTGVSGAKIVVPI